MSHDVVVIGGGPVGLAGALYAARLGLSVCVLEPRTGAIDKACGEGLMPGGLAALADVGVDPAGHPIRGIEYVSEKACATADFSHGPGRGVRRTTLHRALGEQATTLGIEVLPLSMTDLHQREDGVRISTRGPRSAPGPTLTAQHVLAADGLHSPTRRSLGLDRAVRQRGRFGLRRHFAVAPWSSRVAVHWGRSTEAYVTPVAKDTVGVAFLGSRGRSFEDHLADFPDLRSRLEGVAAVSSVQGAGPLRQRSARRVAGRVLLVGDASGYVDALTGEGISLGLAQARAAVDAIVAGRPQGYERTWRAVTWRYSLLTQALLQSTRPRLGRRSVVRLAAAAPGLFRVAVDELARPA